MKAKILDNIQYFEGDKIIGKEMIKKKSDWLKIWKTRKIVLFENKVCFFRSQDLSQQASIQVPLSGISKLEGCDSNPALMKIFSVRDIYQIEFSNQQLKQTWKQMMTNAIRNFKIKKSQFLSVNRLNSRKNSMEVSCQWLNCF